MAKRQIPVRMLYPSGAPWASVDTTAGQILVVLQVWDGTSELFHQLALEREHFIELRDVLNGAHNRLFGWA